MYNKGKKYKDSQDKSCENATAKTRTAQIHSTRKAKTGIPKEMIPSVTVQRIAKTKYTGAVNV